MAGDPLKAIEQKITEAENSDEAGKWIRLRKDYLEQNVERIRARALRWLGSIIISFLLLLGLRALSRFF